MNGGKVGVHEPFYYGRTMKIVLDLTASLQGLPGKSIVISEH
jgi:hypothetical protein